MAHLSDLARRYAFTLGLLAVFALTVADVSGSISGLGMWLKRRHGPDVVIVLIFLASGMLLDTGRVRSGLRDVVGTCTALALIFVVAPVIAALFHTMPLPTGIAIGVALVAAMPTTLSTGVVMTGAAGGNMAHALSITILANAMAPFTVPLTLSFFVQRLGGSAAVTVDKGAILFQLVCFVLVPLAAGMLVRHSARSPVVRIAPLLQRANQALIIGMVWMGLSGARAAIVSGGRDLVLILGLAVAFHGLLLAAAGALIRVGGIGRGRRESVLFMGAQKTLPLAIILQVTLFPQYGQALMFCVIHHIAHLVMDSWLVEKLRNRG